VLTQLFGHIAKSLEVAVVVSTEQFKVCTRNSRSVSEYDLTMFCDVLNYSDEIFPSRLPR
jgi:hypothetical protein